MGIIITFPAWVDRTDNDALVDTAEYTYFAKARARYEGAARVPACRPLLREGSRLLRIFENESLDDDTRIEAGSAADRCFSSAASAASAARRKTSTRRKTC